MQVLTGARDQLMEKIQSLKQSQSDTAKGTEETLLMLNEKNQGLQESLNAVKLDNESTKKQLAEKEKKIQVGLFCEMCQSVQEKGLLVMQL